MAGDGLGSATIAAAGHKLLEAGVATSRNAHLAEAVGEDPIEVPPAPGPIQILLEAAPPLPGACQTAGGPAPEQHAAAGHDEAADGEIAPVAHVEVLGVHQHLVQKPQHGVQDVRKDDRVCIRQKVPRRTREAAHQLRKGIHVVALRAPPCLRCVQVPGRLPLLPRQSLLQAAARKTAQRRRPPGPGEQRAAAGGRLRLPQLPGQSHFRLHLGSARSGEPKGLRTERRKPGRASSGSPATT
mmetsp:Transcript_145999/g.468165  ORF Transcript_145999/g.468165 Transcript_145999/m.468165 type:complete len:241 (-) Transcript_145999:80-802(-)